MSYLDKYEFWKNYQNLDNELKEELNNLSIDEIKEAFYQDLEFGTGGLRGIIGVGTNRMNIYTVKRAAYAFGLYLDSFLNAKEKGVVISFDNRNKSKEFAKKSALVLTNLGYKVYLFENLRPTPELSFAIRHLNAIAGIMITASHNPKEYNGFKVYNNEGRQLIPHEAEKVISIINNIDNIFDINESENEENITYLNADFDQFYINDIINVSINKNLKKDFKIAYTPLHGTGSVIVPQVLKNLGYDITPLQSQMVNDPNFGATLSSNPEEFKAYEGVIKLGKEINADILLATDPDADRLGVCVKNVDDYTLLTGNQTATLIFDYLVKNLIKENHDLTKYYLFDTIVSSSLPSLIAFKHNINVISTLTGFKFIGEQAELIQNKGKFLFGFEESYGCLLKDSVRDKDSLQACIILSEITAYYKELGMNLLDALEEIYKNYGRTKEDISNITLKGIIGQEKIKKIMDYFRDNEIELSQFDILIKEDYQKSVSHDIFNDSYSDLTLPKSNVIKYHLNDDSFFVLRPSGTEPKLKIYYCIKENDIILLNEKMDNLKKDVLKIIENI